MKAVKMALIGRRKMRMLAMLYMVSLAVCEEGWGSCYSCLGVQYRFFSAFSSDDVYPAASYRQQSMEKQEAVGGGGGGDEVAG